MFTQGNSLRHSEMRNTYMSTDEIQWVFMGVFNYYILQLQSQRAPSAFDKASYFTLACVSVKWERVRLIDRGSVEMMHFPCDCFHSYYSQHRVISRPAADTSACACVTEPSHRRVRLPLPQHWSLIVGLNQWAKIIDYVHSYQSACQGRKSWRTDSSHAIYEITQILSPGCHCVTCQRYFGRNMSALTLTSLCMQWDRKPQWQTVSLTL